MRSRSGLGLSLAVGVPRLHDRAAERWLAREPVYIPRERVLAECQDYHRRSCEFQVGRGLLRHSQ